MSLLSQFHTPPRQLFFRLLFFCYHWLVLPIVELHINEITKYIIICFQFLSLNIESVSLRFTTYPYFVLLQPSNFQCIKMLHILTMLASTNFQRILVRLCFLFSSEGHESPFQKISCGLLSVKQCAELPSEILQSIFKHTFLKLCMSVCIFKIFCYK